MKCRKICTWIIGWIFLTTTVRGDCSDGFRHGSEQIPTVDFVPMVSDKSRFDFTAIVVSLPDDWQEAMLSCAGRKIRAHLRYKIDSSDDGWNKVKISDGVNEIIIDEGLEPCTDYVIQLRVRVLGKNGHQFHLKIKNVQTGPKKLGDVKLVHLPDNEVTVSWTHDSSCVQKYSVSTKHGLLEIPANSANLSVTLQTSDCEDQHVVVSADFQNKLGTPEVEKFSTFHKSDAVRAEIRNDDTLVWTGKELSSCGKFTKLKANIIVRNILDMKSVSIYERFYHFYEIKDETEIKIIDIEQAMKVHDYLGPCQIYRLEMEFASFGDDGQEILMRPLNNHTFILSDQRSHIRFGESFEESSPCFQDVQNRMRKAKDLDEMSQRIYDILKTEGTPKVTSSLNDHLTAIVTEANVVLEAIPNDNGVYDNNLVDDTSNRSFKKAEFKMEDNDDDEYVYQYHDESVSASDKISDHQSDLGVIPVLLITGGIVLILALVISCIVFTLVRRKSNRKFHSGDDDQPEWEKTYPCFQEPLTIRTRDEGFATEVSQIVPLSSVGCSDEASTDF